MEKQQEVYVLLRDSTSSGESNQKVQVFQKFDDAKAQMEKEYDAELNDWETRCESSRIVELKSEKSMSISESGFWYENHELWVISKQVVK